MNKREQIQQELNNLANVLGKKSDNQLVHLDNQLANRGDYYVYNKNGEFVMLCKGTKDLRKNFHISPNQKSHKWVVKTEYLGEKIEAIVCKKDHSSKHKRVLQYTLDGQFVKEWDSITQASQTLNVRHSGISFVLIGRGKTAGGFIWKYKD